MPRRYYYKLIRDTVPDVMDTKGVAYEVLALDADAYARALLQKVGEEAAEVMGAKSRGELVREVGDLLDVLDAVRAAYAVTDDELLAARSEQWAKKGGFEKRLFLVWSDDGK